MRRIALALLAQAAILVAAPRAHATFPYPPPPPGTAPQDYAAYLRLPAATPPVRPVDFTGGTEWKLTSDPTGDPTIDSSPAELFGVRGMSVDLAWQVTTGRPDVLIAVLDSGIKWDDVGAMRDLARKVHINRGELPLPRDAAGHTKPESSAGGAFLNPDPYDLNDDGVFDVSDYAGDARVHDRNGNGLLDPQDLIRTFSDGTDGDGNGYVDDIAGWNFLDDDNDPFDEVSYGHGTGEAEDSTAEADNGGALGTCPNCRVMPVRVGDSFIADSNLFAQGVVFAVDSGAHIVQEALGAVNNTSFARAAIEYAWSNDVPVIASAADEESFHHNVPAASRHTITVNSVTRFAEQAGFLMSPHSYLYLNGCTNYGGNIALAIESSSCSSEATGRGSGIAGLLISAALDRVDAGTLQPRRIDPTGAVHPLSADEVAQLLTMTADDIDFSDSDRSVSFILSTFGYQSRRYASQPGWDEYFGYGRANAHRGVLAVAADAVPPEADLLAPDWWETLDPVHTPVVTVTGAAAATHAASYGWELSAGCGVQPAEDSFAPIASASGITAPLGPGTLAQWSIGDTALRCAIDVDGVAHSAPSGTASPGDTPDMFTVTLRLRVTDDAGRRGEARRTLYLHHDPDLRRGFPLAIGGSGEPSPFFVRLRGKAPRSGQRNLGQQQLIVPTADGLILALRSDGHALPGWPAHTDPLPLHTGSRGFTSGALPTTFYESVGGGVAAGDLDGDRRTEIVAGSLAGKLYVWERDGTRRSGFPVRTDPRFSARSARDRFNRLQPGLLAAPVLADLDGDGALEIVAAAMDRHVYVWRADGSQQPGWPVLVVDRTQMASIDPVSDHVVPRVVNGQAVALQGTKIVSTPAVGALLGDGRPVVVVGSNEEYREASNFSSDGNSSIETFQSLGLLDRANGRLHAIPARGTLDPDVAGNPAGPELPGWPVRIGVLAAELLPWIEGVPGSPVLADVDGDGRLEVAIFGVVGPAYVLRADGTSFYGTGADGLPRTLPTDRVTFGSGTVTTDGPSVPGLGGGSFAPVGPGGALVYVAPGAGFGRLADTNVPAQQLPHDTHLDAWNARTGGFLPAFPRLLDDLVFFGSAAIADVNGDGQAELLAGSGGYLVHAMDAATGTEAAGWPKFTGGWIIATPAAGRLGTRQSVAVTTREGTLWVWRVRGRRDASFWPQARHDPTNRGLLAR
jgi:hypothetical protein